LQSTKIDEFGSSHRRLSWSPQSKPCAKTSNSVENNLLLPSLSGYSFFFIRY